jgi:DNA-binding IclR family transcriptional regulator
MPHVPSLREPAKRVRWQIGVLLRRSRDGLRMSDLTRHTGLENNEISPALAKMRASGEVFVTRDEDGKYRYHWRGNGT